MKALSPSKVRIFIENCLKIGEIPYISGPPGIGKSDLVFQVGETWDLKVLDIRLSQKLPEDLTGLPSLDEKKGKAVYKPFDTFPMANDPIPDGYNGWIIFLDELPSASEEVLAAIYSLLLGHEVGGMKVHPKALIIAAGNRSTDSAIARPLPDTIINRMMCVEMKVSSTDWLKWANTPEAKSHDSVTTFIKQYPDMLNSTVDPKTREENEPYNNPRSWKRVFKIMHLHEKEAKANQITKKDASGIPIKASGSIPVTPAIQAMLFSAVGVISGTAFKEFYNDAMQLPHPWEVAQSPSSTKIPDSTSGKAELTSSLAEFFIDTPEQSRNAILQFMNRMDKEHSALFAQIIKERLGQTQSDIKLIEDVKNRLNIGGLDYFESDPYPPSDPSLFKTIGSPPVYKPITYAEYTSLINYEELVKSESKRTYGLTHKLFD